MRAVNPQPLITGATGFLGLEVVREALRAGYKPFVMARGISPGANEISQLAEAGLVTLLRGDLCRSDLGLDRATLSRLSGSIDQVIHVAGLYRLSVGREAVMEVNVEGLRNLLLHAHGWDLRAFHHVSSITAAGKTDAEVPEAPLEKPARFRNAYEESKWRGEALTLEMVKVPLRIYRPGIIVGHSATGEIQKFDGPYAAMGLARRYLPFLAPGYTTAPFPLVTVDLVADILVAGLSSEPRSIEVFHVLDGELPAVRTFVVEMLERLAGHRQAWFVPALILEAAARVPGFSRLTGLEREALAYMTAGWTFATANTANFCAAHGIESRRLKMAYGALTTYYAMMKGRRLYP